MQMKYGLGLHINVCVCVRVSVQLPGVEACDRYTFRYGRNPLMEWPLAFNPSGSARSEPKACQTKRYRDPRACAARPSIRGSAD